MPIEFRLEPTGSSDNSLFRLTMAYDGSGRRISKTRWVKNASSQDWEKELVTHYTGIGTEVRENYHNESLEKANVVVKSLQGESRKNKLACSYDRTAAADAGGVNMPNGLGRYGIEDAGSTDNGSGTGDIPNAKFEWYLKNHLGSTMLVYGSQSDANPAYIDVGSMLAAYDYRAFGEMLELLPPPTGKVTENFTGKEHDDEIALDYFGARYLDPMLGLWISVDPKRQHFSSYVYGSNNPIVRIDPNGLEDIYIIRGSPFYKNKDTGERFVLWEWDQWKKRLEPFVKTMKDKGYSVFVGPALDKIFSRLVQDQDAKWAFYHGHIRGNQLDEPDALSTYFHVAVEAKHFRNLSNQSVELYLFGCNSKSLEMSEWDTVFPNIIGNTDENIDSEIDANQFFKTIEDFANHLLQKEFPELE